MNTLMLQDVLAAGGVADLRGDGSQGDPQIYEHAQVVRKCGDLACGQPLAFGPGL